LSNAANRAKTKWNSKNYSQVKAHIEPELAATFKDACAANGESIASVLSGFMADYSKQPRVRQLPPADPYATRKLRKRALKHFIAQLELLAIAEEQYRDNIPVNLQGSIRYEEADSSVTAVYEALDLLHEMY
jgi:hypothetical protein